ncbi:MAG TPA: zf-HC2 domain-containing protein [Acidimicrobiia bacterium]|nr:zf-HC2 domain-containing protein [Acidimicrobiia bacterium]
MAISAILDGEVPGVAPTALDQHLAGCAGCRSYRAEAQALRRLVGVRPAPEVPDLTSRVMFALAREQSEPAVSRQGLRIGLAVIALVQLGLSLPALLLGSDAGLPVHQARHLGSFGVALAVGLLVAAWRPGRIAGLLPLATALVICLVGSAIADVATGHAAASSEVTHIVEVLGLVGLWLLHRTQRLTEDEPEVAFA